ncbi:MAG: amino acid adenylation domain-containing protein, partial [Alphaproteobacteria bacterium]|nr:amino acid adenylation domain-containing protein [Alphaproteobacteria bacterium]
MLRGPLRPDLIRDELLCEIFATTAARQPTAPALVTAEGRLTYEEVDAQAEVLSRSLLQKGARPGRVVGLWLPRGPKLLIAQIAIAKTGAAWLPFDADAPSERVALCLSDAEAWGLVTDETFAAKITPSCPVWTYAVLSTESLQAYADQKIDARMLGARPEDPAYLIYTSGTTGTPKGIVITSRNICHYLRAANEVYGIAASDTVFQGASVAFDLSMEEIWIPYLVGAALFVADAEMMGEADKLPDLLEAHGVSVLDTVPTLLSLLPRDVPSLRLIILGGEACPPAVAGRWCRPGRKIFNSYGPTEATVVATIAEVRPGIPVSIGRPIPNYTCYVAGENLELLPQGHEGELLIGGPGVAKGYLRRDRLTREKFIANPFPADPSSDDPDPSPADPASTAKRIPAERIDPILYRSGDAVRLEANGEISFRGRIDDQVKIRGFRVELGEIEAKLTDINGIAQAAVVLRNDHEIEQLVAFIVTDFGAELDAKLLRAELRQSLPAYMVPARFEFVASLPKLSSGKVDRKSLKQVELAAAPEADAQEDPRNETEAKLLEAAKRVLPPQAIPFDADFFTDLGGHSLLAARFISVVRETPSLSNITLQDVYRVRTLRALAELLDRKWGDGAAAEDLAFTPPPLLRRFLCGCAQALVLPVIIAMMSAQWLGVFVSYMLLTGADATFLEEAGSLLSVYMCINVATVAIVIAVKWLIIGRTKPGRYPLWGIYYFRWWLVKRFLGLVHIKWFQGSPIMRYYLRALGAKIGKDALISEIEPGAVDLISIGEGASIGSLANFANARVEGNELVIGTIDIGRAAYIGSSCVLSENIVIEEGAELADLTAVGPGSHIGAWESWDGSPARKTGMVDRAALDAPSEASLPSRAIMTLLYVAILLAIPPLGLIPIFPAFWVFDRIDDWIGTADFDRTIY